MNIYVIPLLFGLVLSEQDIREHCRYSCAGIYDPVCGTDNKTYINSCELLCISGSNKDGLSVKHVGRCCSCPNIYEPICASDGKTYKNICELNCLIQKGALLSEKHEGRCLCSCAWNDINEVCGSNDETFVNRCHLECVASEVHDLYEVHEGPCNCRCEDQPLNVTCGTNGQSYANKCLFECERRRVGEIIHQAPDYYCTCGNDYKPVCGSDLNTYKNPCRLWNAIGYNPGMYLLNAGECFENYCGCGDEIDLVCGSDMKKHNLSFRNRCEMECSSRLGNEELRYVKQGYCYNNAFSMQPSVLLAFGIVALYIY